MKQTFRSTTFRLICGVIAVGVPLAVWASTLTIPNSFTPGTPILSSQVNANFTAVQTAVNTKQDAITQTCGANSAITAISPTGTATCTSLGGPFAPTTGGTGYIQNQSASAQNASFNISGNAVVTGTSVVGAPPSRDKFTVAIGANSPSTGIFVTGYNQASGDVGLWLDNTAPGGVAWLIDSTSNTTPVGPGELAFNNIATGTTPMVLQSTNVGIGTSKPGDNLTVDIGNGPVNNGITIQGTSSTYGDIGLKIHNTGTGGGNWFIDSTNNSSGYGGGSLAFVPAIGGTPLLQLNPAGIGGMYGPVALLDEASSPTGEGLKIRGPTTGGFGPQLSLEWANVSSWAFFVTSGGSLKLGQGILGGGPNVGIHCIGEPQHTLAVVGSIAASGTIQGGIAMPDVAENITAHELAIEAGDVVAASPAGREGVVRAHRNYDPTVLGVISTKPGLLTNTELADVESGHPRDPAQRPIALAGRVPVKVTLEGGAIKPGDLLTSSSQPGRAMRAAEPWRGGIIGTALTGYSGTEKKAQVIVFIHLEAAPHADPRADDRLARLEARLQELERSAARRAGQASPPRVQ